MRSVPSDRMGCGIEPRKEECCGGRDARNRRRQYVRHCYARCRRSAGVEGHITSERNASEPERSHVRPQAAEPTGPHREGEEPKPMMHGHEKSGSAIVATKPPNNAGRPAAEAVERRAEAKENANRCCTCRTQCSFSASLISAINQRLDASLAQFAGRPLAEAFPYLILDARCERVRETGVIVSQAVLIAIGIDWDGRRQVLAVELANRESRSSWRDFLMELKARGLHGVEFVVADDHAVY